ncbi:MAG: hypothetical protein ACO3JL_12015, partial [Myxococcota bacterium]
MKGRTRTEHDEGVTGQSPCGDAVMRSILLLGPVFLLALFCKVHKGSRLSPASSLLELASLGASDFLLFAAATLLLTLVLSITRGRMRVALATCAHVGVPLFGSFLLLEHVFFLVSGTVGDLYIVIDVLSRLSGLAGVIRSEATITRLIFLALPLMLSGAAAWYTHYQRRRWNGREAWWWISCARSGPLLGGSLALMAFLALARPADGALGLVHDNVFWGLA